MQLYYKLVLSISFLLEYRLYKACLTTVCTVFKQKHAQRRAESGCFGFNGPGQKDVVAVLPARVLGKVLFTSCLCSETQTKRNESGISCIVITKYHQ